MFHSSFYEFSQEDFDEIIKIAFVQKNFAFARGAIKMRFTPVPFQLIKETLTGITAEDVPTALEMIIDLLDDVDINVSNDVLLVKELHDKVLQTLIIGSFDIVAVILPRLWLMGVDLNSDIVFDIDSRPIKLKEFLVSLENNGSAKKLINTLETCFVSISGQ